MDPYLGGMERPYDFVFCFSSVLPETYWFYQSFLKNQFLTLLNLYIVGMFVNPVISTHIFVFPFITFSWEEESLFIYFF